MNTRILTLLIALTVSPAQAGNDDAQTLSLIHI